MKSKQIKNIQLALVASLTIGLTPFFPEPHIVGKIRWVMGGAKGMEMMDWFDLLMHGAPWIILIFLVANYFLNKKSTTINMEEISNLIHNDGACIIDVREKFEFDSRHVKGAKNVPLSRIKSYVEDIKSCDGPVVLYCRSGNRSGQAAAYLNSLGVSNAVNGGGLYEMEMIMNNDPNHWN